MAWCGYADLGTDEGVIPDPDLGGVQEDAVVIDHHAPPEMDVQTHIAPEGRPYLGLGIEIAAQ